LEEVNVSPVRAVPVMAGSAVFVGAMSTTTVVGSDVAALEEPTPFVAITASLMKYPTSDSVTTYELLVAAVAMFEYTPPDVAERVHWYEYEVGEPDHVPVDVVDKVSPVRAVPLNVGTPELAGAEEAK
jgi:hypothetical protein